ncbi:hypothetical protein NKR23_g10031 [Pleurostoma richardsiae]|uniref:Uncharacterized protein n=1 Tax=Pleurostoma richardsiae TaxID=41990 RepID=A0AA38R533_9PEZI|nr:hypothetical protein NKR23_g10031 [Pleurostoma richardsiae]
MDPVYQEATQRFKKPKAREQARRQTKFQRQLARNPYAQALATPSRHCPVTRITLPRFFLQDFRIVEHPESKQPWWVPASLAPTRPAPAQLPSDGHDAPKSTRDGDHETGGSSTTARRHGQARYVLSRRSLLESFMKPGTSYHRGQKRLQAMSSNPQQQALAGRAVWREDMDDLVLELMRRRIVEELLFMAEMSANQGRKYVRRLGGWNEIRADVHRGCVLWIDGTSTEEVDERDGAHDARTTDGPGEFATVDLEEVKRDAKLPVHNLVSLLGREQVYRLRQGSPTFREGTLFLLSRQRTIDLQLKLWKLQGYLATFGRSTGLSS